MRPKQLFMALIISGLCAASAFASYNIDEIKDQTSYLPLGDLSFTTDEFFKKEITPWLPPSALGINKKIYYLITGYKVQEVGIMSTKPSVSYVSWKLKSSHWVESERIRYTSVTQAYTPKTISPFFWFHLLEEVEDLPQFVCPYLQGTKIIKVSFDINNDERKNVLDSIKSLSGTNVQIVDLSGIDLGSKIAEDLGKAFAGTKVHTVDLSCNSLGNKGICNFIRGLAGTEINNVDVSHNYVGDKGGRYISQAFKETNVHTVNLYGNKINAEDLMIIAQDFKDTKIQKVYLKGRQYNFAKLRNDYPAIEWISDN